MNLLLVNAVFLILKDNTVVDKAFSIVRIYVLPFPSSSSIDVRFLPVLTQARVPANTGISLHSCVFFRKIHHTRH
jgi:hypothetical protein